MKIAIIGSASFDSLEYHIHDELEHSGHAAKIFDYQTILPSKVDYGLHLFSPKYEALKNKRLLGKILDFRPDLVIGIYRHIHPLVVKGVKDENIKIIHINPDQLTTLKDQQLFVEPYDAYFTKDRYMLDFMKNKLELNTFLYQEAFNPRVHQISELSNEELEAKTNIDVLFFGNIYPYRGRIIKLIDDGEYNVTTYGRCSRFFHPSVEKNMIKGFITGSKKSEIIRGAKIVFNNFHYAEVASVNNKFFEINGSGGFQICDYKPILNELLPVDPSLVSFKNIQEAKMLIRKYIHEPEERWEIRDKINAHFIQNYTYKQMLNNILETL